MQFVSFKLADGRVTILRTDRIVCCTEDTVNIDGALVDVVTIDYKINESALCKINVIDNISTVFFRLAKD